MFGRSQARSWRTNYQQHNHNHQGVEPLFEINSTVPKPKPQRGRVKQRVRAARKAQRLALEEEERKASARAQAKAEAAENAIRISGMQNTLHKQQQDAQDKMTEQTAKEASDRIFSMGKIQNAVQEDESKAPVEKKIKSFGKSSYLADLEGLVFESAAESEENAGEELDLEAGGGGFAECVCEIICVCDRLQCKCSDGCICA